MSFDTTKSKYSLATAVTPLIAVMDNMTKLQIDENFLSILNDCNLHISDETRKKWKAVIIKTTSKTKLMFAITGLYLKGANLGVK